MKFKVKKSLKQRYTISLIFLVFTLLIVTFAVAGLFIDGRSRTIFSKNFMRDTKELVNYFSKTLAEGLLQGDEMLILQTLDKIKEMETIEYALLFDHKGGIKYHTEVFARKKLTVSEKKLFENLFRERKINVHPPFNPQVIHNTYLISKAFYDKQGRFFGMLLVKYTTTRLQKILTGIRFTFLVILLIALVSAFLGAIVFAVILANATAKPILKLAEGSKMIDAGNLDYVLDIEREDEIGLLADYFNQMTRRIKKGQTALIEHQLEEEQLLVAGRIQNSYFPAKGLANEHFELEGFSIPAKFVGGDYYQFKKLDDERLFLVLADVSGKGIPAALVTSMFDAVMESLVTSNFKHDAAKFITEANRALSNKLLLFERYVTLLVCIFDQKENRINFSSAGHGDLLIYRNRLNAYEYVRCKALPIGISTEIKYQSRNIFLEPGDAVILYSDGIRELRNTEGEIYGSSRLFYNFYQSKDTDLKGYISAQQKDLKEFAGGAEQHDDMTMLVLRKKI